MWRNRILYLIALAAVSVFYAFFYAWFSEFLWLLILALPVLSLVFSLPAMLLTGITHSAPGLVNRGQDAMLTLQTRCILPQPRCRFRLVLSGTALAQPIRRRQKPETLILEAALPTAHCGRLLVSEDRVWVCDYLGLFAIPRHWKQTAQTLVLPTPLAPKSLPSIRQLTNSSTRPKPGGGFAESYELRDYRPGDSLRQIHWKLTAKTDEPVIREPQEPQQGPVVLTCAISPDPDQRDLTLGKVLYLSRWLLEQGYAHQVRWFSGTSPHQQAVSDFDGLPALASALAAADPTDADSPAAALTHDASWHHHVQQDD